MKNILFFHQSADLYGSDKVLLMLVRNLPKSYHPIVLLPCNGPLASILSDISVEYYIVPLIKISRSTLNIQSVIAFPFTLWKSHRAISQCIKGYKIHLVHSNTLAVLSGAIWACLRRVPHVWHVHEIITHPWWARKGFALLLRWMACRIICISDAVRASLLKEQSSLEKKIVVIWNGLEVLPLVNADTKAECVHQFNTSIGLLKGELLITLIGRINRWKGQLLLVDAAKILKEKGVCDVRYLIMGSAPLGQDQWLEMLMQHISNLSLTSQIIIRPFSLDVETVWDATDIAVVPSTEPEPFGLVALEAMRAGKPVIASNHGGITEIVKHKETGLLFAPNSAEDLAQSIFALWKNAQLREIYGKTALLRSQSEFSCKQFVYKIVCMYSDLLRNRQ